MLVLLLGFIIYLFRGERVKRDELEREMKELGVTRELTRKAYGCLLELASQGEVASIWSESDLWQYRRKKRKDVWRPEGTQRVCTRAAAAGTHRFGVPAARTERDASGGSHEHV